MATKVSKLARKVPAKQAAQPLAAPPAEFRPVTIAAFVSDPIGTSKLFLVGVQAVGGRSGPMLRASRVWRSMGVTHPAILTACDEADAKNAALAASEE